MSEHREQTIDLSELDNDAAARLLALFEASARAARQNGDEAGETFLLGLCSVMLSHQQHRAAQGEPMPGPVAVDTAGMVSVKGLTAEDTLRGARYLLMSGERLADEGHERLGEFFGSLAEQLAKLAGEKAKASREAVN